MKFELCTPMKLIMWGYEIHFFELCTPMKIPTNELCTPMKFDERG